MGKAANIYEICDSVILRVEPKDEPGRNLQLIYKKTMGNLLLKHLVLKWCRHLEIPQQEIYPYQQMFRAAINATIENWHDSNWIVRTFQPIARLLDKIKNSRWQIRHRVALAQTNPSQEPLRAAIDNTLKDILRVWRKDKRDPFFPVAAQVVLSGDDYMNGENFLNVLCGLGSFEYQNITLLFAFARCFIMANPSKLWFFRSAYPGISEPMVAWRGWMWHRTAYYDAIFFEHLLAFVTRPTPQDSAHIVDIMEKLIRFIVIDSQEWVMTPRQGIEHPAITCLPKGNGEQTLCRLSKADWQTKRDLGFGDYLPDMDTTFLSLSMARKWLDFVDKHTIKADQSLLLACEKLLDHPYIAILSEYQSGHNYSPATIHITRPLDYYGAVPIWFDKQFLKPDGRVVGAVLGNEICSGHNMDILESILVNRKPWKVFENIDCVQRLIEFHYRAFTSGNFKEESAYAYYLPEIYVYFTGRMYDTFLTLSPAEQQLLDPEGKIATIRDIAIDYCWEEMVGYTLNPFDAALAVAALVLLRYEHKDDGIIASGLKIMLQAIGEGRRGHPFLAYEWTRMRHPTRIIVGSPVATSFFVMNALVLACHYLACDDDGATFEPLTVNQIVCH